VIIDDSLGIAEELEMQMQYVADTFACEWKEAINNPETLKRFRSFVNSDEVDNNVVFVEERGQIRPATAQEKAGRIAVAEV
jgi:nitrite reductase (NADH) large subunit